MTVVPINTSDKPFAGIVAVIVSIVVVMAIFAIMDR